MTTEIPSYDQTRYFAERLLRELSERLEWAKPPGLVLQDIYMIQLYRPDRWILFLTSRTSKEKAALIRYFEGEWKKALRRFSPDRLLKSLNLKRAWGKGETTLDQLVSHVIYEDIKQLSTQAIKNADAYGLHVDCSEAFAFKGFGLFDNLDLEAYASGQIQAIRATPEPPEMHGFPSSNFSRTIFFWQFARVNVLLGSQNDPAEELNRYLNTWRPSFRKQPTWILSFDDMPLTIFQEGVVVVDHKHSKEAIEVLSDFAAAAFLSGVDCSTANSAMVGKLDLNEMGQVTSWSLPSEFTTSTQECSQQVLNRIKRLLDVSSEKKICAELRLCHLGCLHLGAGELLAGFILIWATVEHLLDKMWSDCVTDSPSSNRMVSLTDNRFTVSVKIDVMEVMNILKKDDIAKLHGCRKARNAATHNGVIPKADTIAQCIGLAWMLICKRLGETEGDTSTRLVEGPPMRIFRHLASA